MFDLHHRQWFRIRIKARAQFVHPGSSVRDCRGFRSDPRKDRGLGGWFAQCFVDQASSILTRRMGVGVG